LKNIASAAALQAVEYDDSLKLQKWLFLFYNLIFSNKFDNFCKIWILFRNPTASLIYHTRLGSGCIVITAFLIWFFI